MNGTTEAARPLTDAEIAKLPREQAAAVYAMRQAFAPVPAIAAEYRRRGYRSVGRLVRRCGDELAER